MNHSEENVLTININNDNEFEINLVALVDCGAGIHRYRLFMAIVVLVTYIRYIVQRSKPL